MYRIRVILATFILWRAIDFFITYVSTVFVPPDPSFPFKWKILPYFLVPSFTIPLANFDGVHYLSIARSGYHEFEQAFFPLYPLLIHLTFSLTHTRYFLMGILISNLAFLGGLIFFSKFLKVIGASKNELIFTVLFLLFFPTSFFFGAVYTEGLFFLLFSASLYFLATKRYFLGAITGFFSALSRLVGVFISILGIVAWYYTKRFTPQSESSEKKLFIKERIGELCFIAGPILGLLTYMIYLYRTTGDFLAFYSAQPQFGQNRSSHIIFLPQVYYRYINIFFHTQNTFALFIAIIEFAMFNFMLVVLLYDLYQLFVERREENTKMLLGLNLFSLLNLLLPTLTGTLVSMPRYSLFSLSVFIRLARIRSMVVKALLLGIFGVFHVVLFLLFLQGNFVG